MPELMLDNEADIKYFEDCKNDLRLTLLVNKGGVRVRDIKGDQLLYVIVFLIVFKRIL